MRTEAEIQRSFRKLFKKDAPINREVFDRAQKLIDELRLESPLRHRLDEELQELRKLHNIEEEV